MNRSSKYDIKTLRGIYTDDSYFQFTKFYFHTTNIIREAVDNQKNCIDMYCYVWYNMFPFLVTCINELALLEVH